ncbi:DUF7283 family protein [Natronorubrum halophilum]|uniref:DUF7283 family protein n=1 Tax=Natronorubrum halophilum TaxID=1702106 RepID=UPI0010C204A2|nr:hypothetical protein [Natronorubrum halophilum]
MDWEAPADAWYVWFAVSIISLAMVGVVLGLPTGPPPDADRAANAVEGTSGSSYEAASTYGHDAEAIKIDGKTIEMRNEHGTDRSSIRYGQVVVVNGDDRLERLVYGSDFETEFESEIDDPHEDAVTVFMDRVANAEETNADEWLPVTDDLTVRRVTVEPDEMTSIRTEGGSHETVDLIADTHSVPQSIHIQYEGFDEHTAVEYTIEGDSVIEDEYEDADSFWEQVEDTFSDWVEAADCWLSDCDDEGDPEDEIQPTHAVDTDGWDPMLHHGSGTREISMQSHISGGTGDPVWAGDYPLDVTAEFDGHTCEGTLHYSGDEDELCPRGTASDDRVDELGWIELNDETGRYHVTLVVV